MQSLLSERSPDPGPAAKIASWSTRSSGGVLLAGLSEDADSSLAAALSRCGVPILRAADARTLSGLLSDGRPDVLVLDEEIAGGDAFEFCRRLADRPSPAVILLSASCGVAERVVALEIGADDCLPSNCHPRELTARVRALLRRLDRWRGPPDPAELFYAFAGWCLSGAKLLYNPDGKMVALSRGDLALLRLFLARAGQVVSRAEICALEGDEEVKVGARPADYRVCRLRRRLGDTDTAQALIRTIRGRGYLLDSQVTVSQA